jgi:hypothetical protein
LSAENTFVAPSFFSPSPITPCEEPYIGEESIMRPPAAKNARITLRSNRARRRSLPTLKVIQLPSPTSGIASPLDGIGRVRTALVCAAAGHDCCRTRGGKRMQKRAAAKGIRHVVYSDRSRVAQPMGRKSERPRGERGLSTEGAVPGLHPNRISVERRLSRSGGGTPRGRARFTCCRRARRDR